MANRWRTGKGMIINCRAQRGKKIIRARRTFNNNKYNWQRSIWEL